MAFPGYFAEKPIIMLYSDVNAFLDLVEIAFVIFGGTNSYPRGCLHRGMLCYTQWRTRL